MLRKAQISLGALLLLAGVVAVGSAFDQSIWSNVRADQDAQRVGDEIAASFADPSGGETPTATVPVEAESGATFSAIGLVYIPRLKADVWGTPLISGTSERDLAIGIGHYESSAGPGEVGNFAIAGHRATNGEPFARFEKLAAGDEVIVQTSAGYFTYKLIKNQKIQTNEIWVLAPSPEGLETSVPQLITLTTCEPRWNSTKRWAWWGELAEFSQEPPAVLLEASNG